MNRTNIEWVKNPDGTQGYTWNPITGCLKGCEYCWARGLACGRLRSRMMANDPGPEGMDDPFYPRFWPERLYHPWNGQPKGIFPVSMGDLFGIGIPAEWTYKVLNLCRLHGQNRYYLLTKQPQELAKWSPFPDNCWVGVSVTNGGADLAAALEALQAVKAAVKYISFEPLLGAVNICPYPLHWWLKVSGINWLIIGAQTKPYIAPKVEWVREIVKAADKAGIPVFLKESLNDIAPLNGSHEPFLRYGPAGELRLRQEMPKVA